MSKWEISTIKEISKTKLEYGSGASAKDYDGNVRYIRITDISDDGKLNDNIASPSEYDIKYLLNDGDILFARSGATVGKTFRYRKSYGKAIYAGYLIRLIPDIIRVLPDYVFYFTKTPYYTDFIKTNSKTVAQPNINAKQYGELKIPLPPLDVQQKIADVLDKASAFIEKRKTQMEKLDLLIKSQFIEMFGDPVTNPKGLKSISLANFALLKAGKNVTANNIHEISNTYCYPCYGGNGVRGYIDKYSHEGNYPLIGRQGALCGNVQFATGRFFPTEHAVVVYPIENYEAKWMFYTLTYMNLNRLQTGAAQPGLNIDILNQVNIPIPSYVAQKQFTAFVQKVEEQKSLLQHSLQKLELNYKSLMQKCFKGELF